ncbi:L-threonine dehydratase biosynthetic IlvA [Anaerobiospirillum thomasii]|uniref:threonine ammonia-lyase, biosynthetic n=1 Tax=Anaerobiospirillum thomasii TaxID=179995 RepID=UPI000D9BA95F|nr:threonine ammonia-lyase, biosynthetic [Anaerobiospirillum thomasii]SPT72184.1 L-threonine dehydratase biosynthetic IlvA [Anaerobiospirillum thomasii]
MENSQQDAMQKLTGQEYLRKILLARIYKVARFTPLHKLDKLSERLGVSVMLKREDFQGVHSFKIRGAYNKISSLETEKLEMGVIAASAGNHAQGVALSAKELGIKATIVMPVTTPDLKVDAVKRLGANIVLYGETFNEAYDHAQELAKTEGLTMIPPYDDPDVIAGQGTIAHEILGQCNDINTIFVQIGGGGLAAGIAVYIKNLIPKIRVVGVEAEGSACMKAALENGRTCDIGFVSHFADGVAVSRAGEETFRLCKMYLDEIITCSNDEICAAMKDIFDDTRAIAEPSGALSLAGLKKYAREHDLKGQDGSFIAIMSGANVKFHTLRMVAERCDVGEMTEGILSVEIPEKKGAFLNFCKTIGQRHVTEFSYRLSHKERARILASIELTNGKSELNKISSDLRQGGFLVTDLTDDAITKDHVRYMVGGHPTFPNEERLFLFEFPNSKNALIQFLEKLGDNFSISLFHFRISGLEFCSVLCAFDVTDSEDSKLMEFIKKVNYPVTEISSNTAYQQFLR